MARLKTTNKSLRRPRPRIQARPLLDDSFTWRHMQTVRWVRGRRTAHAAHAPAGAYTFWRRQITAWEIVDESDDTHETGYGFAGIVERSTPESLMIASGDGKPWQPLREQQALFKRFADLDPTKENLLRFARTYGLLGCSVPLVEPREGTDWPVARGATGECLKDWRVAHADLHRAVRIWDLTRADRRLSLAEQRWLAEATNVLVAERAEDTSSQLIVYARQFLSALVTGYLTGNSGGRQPLERRAGEPEPFRHAAPLTLCDFDGGAERPFALRVRPQSLLSTLWLQFTDAMQMGRSYARCSYCNKWFLRTRSDRLLCSPSCNTLASRQKKLS